MTCNMLQHTAAHCNTLPDALGETMSMVRRDILGLLRGHDAQYTATHCNTLQHTAAHCNTLQHTATHCNTLQYTAAHCNTLLAARGETMSMVQRVIVGFLRGHDVQHTATHCNALHYTSSRAKWDHVNGATCYSGTFAGPWRAWGGCWHVDGDE